jgi:hypothetical protein
VLLTLERDIQVDEKEFRIRYQNLLARDEMLSIEDY